MAFVFLAMQGCSVVNFSANYYTPPPEHLQEIHGLWKKLMADLPLKHGYRYVIVGESEAKGLKGIPAITQDNTVVLPENFVKYVYQNYYDDRMKVFTCIIVHELCHREYGLPSSPPEEHFKVDLQAIKLLGADATTAHNYYKSLYVMRNYWYARKGVAGHTFNVGWNAVNAASVALGGPGAFVDWFATDLDRRLNMLEKNYRIWAGGAFERSTSP